MSNIAVAQFTGFTLPPNHPLLNTTWIGREIGVLPDTVGVSLIYVVIGNDGHYTAWSYYRNFKSCGLNPLTTWTGVVKLLSGNVLVAWNDGVIGKHGYLLVFDNRWQMAQATLFSKTTTIIENSIWTRTTAELAPVIQLLEQFTCP